MYEWLHCENAEKGLHHARRLIQAYAVTDVGMQYNLIARDCLFHLVNVTVYRGKQSDCYTVHLDRLNLLANIRYQSFSAVLLLFDGCWQQQPHKNSL